MRRKLRSSTLLAPAALLVSVLMAMPAGADPQNVTPSSGRSHLEDPDEVSLVRIHLTGTDMLDAVNEAGFDIAHGLTRVPTGIEGEAVVTATEIAELEAMGVEILADGEGFDWAAESDETFVQSFSTETIPPFTHEEAVRIARADWFTTKGQGFLYVEARTTEGLQTNPVVTMQLENDSGPGTQFGFARTMSRFVDSGQYMFHRNLFKLNERPTRFV